MFDYDTRTAEAGRFRYILTCPNCGKENRVLKTEYMIVLESAGMFLGIFLGWYFLLHDPLYQSLLAALVIGIGTGLASYYLRVYRPGRSKA
jgi:hypothetical protein